MNDYPLEEPFFTKLTVQVANLTRTNRCFIAFYNSTSQYQLVIKDCDCSQKHIYICQRRIVVKPNCSESYGILNSTLDILWDPRFQNYRKESLIGMRNKFMDKMLRLDTTRAYEAIFQNLWYSSIPCFDIEGVTAKRNGERALLKYCEWKGVQIPCAAIFTTFPTDKGMCCAFNMKAADEVFQGKTYPRIIKTLQNRDKQNSFSNSTLPSEFAEKIEPKTIPGRSKGLVLIIDAHSDLFAPASVDSNINGFIGLVGPTNSFPFMSQEGFDIKPGQSNTVTLSGYRIDADESLRSLKIKDRNCRFPDENSDLKIYKEYSYANCIFECSLLFAKYELKIKKNLTDPCIPWYFPSPHDTITICNPWDAMDFVDLMMKVNFYNLI
jgi:hypothetical protein